MELYLNAIKPNIVTSVGSLSNKKMELLDGFLLQDYPKRQSPISSTVIYFDPVNRKNVIVGPNQIGFGVDGKPHLTEDIPQRISEWRVQSKKIAECLLLDPDCIGHEFEISGRVNAHGQGNKSAANQSVQKFSSVSNKNFKERIGVSPVAVGIRYIFKRDKFLWDCATEPLMADLSQFTLTANIKIDQGKYSFDQVFDNLETCIKFFTDEWFVFIKNEILI